MTKTKRGFTIVEVMLVLAISGLAIAGIMRGITSSVARQRYNDSVNSFVDFLKNVYSEAASIQNSNVKTTNPNKHCSLGTVKFNSSSLKPNNNPGRSNCIIYGKAIVFGETDQNGSTDETGAVHVYDIIGSDMDTDDKGSDEQGASNTLSLLKKVGVDILTESSSGKVAYALGHYSYIPEWGARIENTENSDPYEGTILITRSPLTNSINTFVLNGKALTANEKIGKSATYFNTGTFLSSEIDNFKTEEVNFCVGSADYKAASSRRRDVRIRSNGHSSSAVQLINADDATQNKCKEV